ncbi:nickel-responsive transcriptional regulator NikR [Sporosarcina sp. Te-1]|uniref:nickel-responsive transcriptional regulator NikR n=1 Tax=Sporosarcina sp. Te-1 TaxID=2818390 RepID=UPI001A9DE00A|nr:nickel-responsive transcriptional regulator NikR [Sporosarcina sp. Te-1]QTD41019.1 nickel-responsive transcriptional regulator NikR [Sporosarcina sp. Te-1]
MSESTLKRIGISMENGLLKKFDHLIQARGYETRSEAVRDLVRDALLQHIWEQNEDIVAGTIVLFYNHSHKHLLEEMTEIQHGMHANILATTHFHLDHDNCLELIVVKGKASDIQTLSHQLTSLKGVSYGTFTVAPITAH